MPPPLKYTSMSSAVSLPSLVNPACLRNRPPFISASYTLILFTYFVFPQSSCTSTSISYVLIPIHLHTNWCLHSDGRKINSLVRKAITINLLAATATAVYGAALLSSFPPKPPPIRNGNITKKSTLTLTYSLNFHNNSISRNTQCCRQCFL